MAAAEEWLTQQQIEQALSGNTAVATGSTSYRQYFDPEGATVYVPEGGQPSRGKRRTSADNTYCSWWAGTGWSCYRLSGDGDRITWHAQDGSTWPAVIVEGRQLD
jgi:hypothetical protein